MGLGFLSQGDFSNLRVRARELVSSGAVCCAWENRDRFRDDTDRFQKNALQLWADAGVAPDLLVANGGAHYSTKELAPFILAPEIRSWLHDAATAMELPLLSETVLVVTSSPSNG